MRDPRLLKKMTEGRGQTAVTSSAEDKDEDHHHPQMTPVTTNIISGCESGLMNFPVSIRLVGKAGTCGCTEGCSYNVAAMTYTKVMANDDSIV